MLKVVPKAGSEIVGGRGLEPGGFAQTVTTQESQQLSHLTPFTMTGLGAGGSMSTPAATLVPLNVDFAKISQRHAALSYDDSMMFSLRAELPSKEGRYIASEWH